MAMDVVTNSMQSLLLDDEIDTLPAIPDYFPKNMPVYWYEPAEDNKEENIIDLNGWVQQWLRGKKNKNFVFQCLLCNQEMTFQTVFCRGHNLLNRSHLLTKKHLNNVNQSSIVGLLFTSSKKFIVCRKTELEKGHVLSSVTRVKRRINMILRKPDILGKVFCVDHKMFTFDPKTKSLSELIFTDDIVNFMINCVRPLFNFFCFFCNKESSSFNQVVEHLRSKKHIQKKGLNKGVILSVKEYNVFVSCKFELLSTFLLVKHNNSYLEELILAGDESILIAGCYTKIGKAKITQGPVALSLKSVKMPDGSLKNDSIRIMHRFNDIIEDSKEEQSCNALTPSPTDAKQKNVLIYEFSSTNFSEHVESTISSAFNDGCQMWCSRCSKGLYSVSALRTHLSSPGHLEKVRSSIQVGFMCHLCKTFFVDLKGELFSHIHSSPANKKILRILNSNKPQRCLTYQSDLYKRIINVLQVEINLSPDSILFCCLACENLSKQKLSDLPTHECSNVHKFNEEKCIFTFCSICNVVYIALNVLECQQLVEHFKTKSHLSLKSYEIFVGNNSSVIYENPKKATVDISSTNVRKLLGNSSLTLRLSKHFCQFANPGVTENDFSQNKNVNIFSETFLEDSQFLNETKYSCLNCALKEVNVSDFVNHLTEKPCSGEEPQYLKYCDICKVMLYASQLSKLQDHFISGRHVDNIRYYKTGSFYIHGIVNRIPEVCVKTFKRKYIILQTISTEVGTLNKTWLKRKEIIKIIKRDATKIFIKSCPNVEVRIFGSTICRLATDQSDVDILLYLDDCKRKDLTKFFENQTSFKLIGLSHNLTTSLPMIRTTHAESGLLCEFTWSHPEGALITTITSLLIDFDVRVHEVIAVALFWTKSSMSFPTLTPTMVTWLVLYYLMDSQVRVVPPVNDIVHQLGGLKQFEKYEVGECPRLEWSRRRSDQSSLELLQGFFHYYAFLPFPSLHLDPRTGLANPRSSSEGQQHPISMIDPFQPTRNLFQLMYQEKMEEFQYTCYLTLHLGWRLN